MRRLAEAGEQVTAIARSDSAAAAQTTRGGSRAVFRRVNVEGTANVIQACRQAGVRRLVHVGTEAALFAGDPVVGIDETAPLRPPLDYMTPWLSSLECTIDITKARTELGYEPVRSRAEGLAGLRDAGRKSP